MLIVKLPAIDAFVSGHTHAPGLRVVRRVDGEQAVAVNCGCWLREFTPVHTRFKGPQVFVSRFVLTHVRILRRGDGLRVELWEHPKPVAQRLTRVVRLVSRDRIPHQTPRRRQTARDRRLRDLRMKLLWHWRSRCVA
jgi:hypothetical protein